MKSVIVTSVLLWLSYENKCSFIHFQMYAGNDIFCRGEVIACYNLRYRKEHCSLYSHLPCFFASELSMFSIKEPKAYLRSSWILLTTKLKVLDLFVDDHNSRLYSIATTTCSTQHQEIYGKSMQGTWWWKYIQWLTMLSLTIWAYRHSFSWCCLLSLWNSLKFELSK